AAPGEAPKVSLSDPYLIAYLRGGKNEALRVASVSLIDRRLLKVKDETGLKTRADAEAQVKRPIEKALLQYFRPKQGASRVYDDVKLGLATAPYERTLTELKLIPDEAMKQARRRLLLAVLVLVGVAVLKILIALARGRTNVGFLFFLTVVAVIAAVKVAQSA